MLAVIIVAIIFLIGGVYAVYNYYYPSKDALSLATLTGQMPSGVVTTTPPRVISPSNAYVPGTMYNNPTWTLVWSNGPNGINEWGNGDDMFVIRGAVEK